MPTESSYPCRFASPRRDCAQDSRYTGKGEFAWSAEIGLNGATAQPCVLRWGAHAVVVAGFGTARFSPTGERSWERRRHHRGTAVIANDRLYYQSADLGLDAVDAANATVLDDAPIPGVGDEDFHVRLIWPGAEEFVVVSYLPAQRPEPEDLGAGQPKPLIAARRVAYGSTMGAWSRDYSGFPRLPVLFVPALNRLLVGFNEVKVVDVQAGAKLPGFSLPLAEHVDWSADSDGGLCVLGYDAEERKVVVGLGPDGQEQWRWVDEVVSDRWIGDQPPIRGADGRVYALTQGRVLALDAGVLTWSFDAWSDSLRHGATLEGGTFTVEGGQLRSTETLRHGTALADGSVLVTGGPNLRHLSPDGIKLSAIRLGEDILSPPVVAEDGGLYLTTANSLFKFD